MDSRPWTQKSNRFSLGIIFFVLCSVAWYLGDGALIRPFLAIQSWSSEARKHHGGKPVKFCVDQKWNDVEANFWRLLLDTLQAQQKFLICWDSNETERLWTCTLSYSMRVAFALAQTLQQWVWCLPGDVVCFPTWKMLDHLSKWNVCHSCGIGSFSVWPWLDSW